LVNRVEIMKVQKFVVVLLALFMVSMNGAWAHGWRTNVGVYVGPGWGPVWYPPPYYYPPQVIVVPPPAPPPVYIEQQQEAAPTAAPASAGNQHWYYCASAKGYYPYIKECPGGWQKVLAQPER
jgi:hypothetical protein